MVIREEIEMGGRKLMKNYSDKNVYIKNAQGAKYTVAVDPIEYADVRVYTETDEPIPERKENELKDKTPPQV